MAYSITNPTVAGFLPIASIDSGVVPPGNANTGSTTTIPTPPLALGMIVQATDPTYGAGEFILLKGVASTAVGDAVTYDASFATARAAAGSNLPDAVAFAMAANTAATTYSWYQISGIAVANKTKTVSMAAGIAVGISTTALISVSSSGKEIEGALVAVVASATTTTKNGNKVQLMINRPHMQGRIT